MESVTRMASQKAVVIFGKTSCCMCHTVKSLFSDLGVHAMVHELDEDSRGRELERALLKKGCNPAIPTVFIGGQLFGGANEIMARHLNGSLEKMFKVAGVIWL